MTRCSARRLSSALQGGFLLRRLPSNVFGFQFNAAPLGFCAFMTSSSTCQANVDSQGIFANNTLALQERVSIQRDWVSDPFSITRRKSSGTARQNHSNMANIPSSSSRSVLERGEWERCSMSHSQLEKLQTQGFLPAADLVPV